MPAGAEIYRLNGTKRFDLSTRPFNLLGIVQDTGKSNGSRVINGLTPGGRPNFFPMPLVAFNDRIPNIWISNGVLYWQFANSGSNNNCNQKILFGEW